MSSTPSPAPPQGGGRSQRARQVEAFDGACTQLFLIPIASVFHAGAGLEADLGALMPHGKRKLCETFYAKHPEYKYPSSPASLLEQKDGTSHDSTTAEAAAAKNNADTDNNLEVAPNTPVPTAGGASPTLTPTAPGCPNGAECPFIHADLREVTPMIVHRNLMYSGVHMCKYRRLVNTAGEAIIAEKEPGLGLLDVEGSTESLRAQAVRDILNAARIDVLAPNGRPPYQSYNLNVLLHTDGAKILFNYLVDPQFEALRLAIRTRHAQLLATNAEEGQEPVPPPPTDVLQIRLEERITPAGEDPVPPPPADVVERGDPAAPYSHCAHFYFNRLCYRGEMCHFVHCVHVDNLLAVEDDGIAVSPAPPSVNSFPSIRTRNGGAGTDAQGGGHRATPNESRRGGGGAAHHHHSAPISPSHHQYPSNQYVPAGYAVGMYPIHSTPAGFVPYQPYASDSMAIHQYPMQHQHPNQHHHQQQQVMYQPQQQMMMPSMMAPMHGMYNNTGMMDPSLQGGGGGGTWQFVPQQQQTPPFFANNMMSGSGSSAAISNYSPTHQVQYSMPIQQHQQQFVVPQQQHQMPYGFLSQLTTTTNGAASVNSTPPASVSSWMGSTGGVGGPQPRSARRSSTQQVNVMPDPFQPNSTVLVGSGNWGGSSADYQSPNIMGAAHQAASQSNFGSMGSYNQAQVAPSLSRHSTPHVQGSPQHSTASPPSRTLNGSGTHGKEQTITIQGRVMSTPTLGITSSLRNSSTSSIVGQSPHLSQHRVTSSSQGASVTSVTVGMRNNSDQPQLWAANQQQQGGAQQGGVYPSAFQQQQGQPSSSSHHHQTLRQ